MWKKKWLGTWIQAESFFYKSTTPCCIPVQSDFFYRKGLADFVVLSNQRQLSNFSSNSNEDASWDREQPVELWLDWLTCLVSERQRHFLIDYNLIFQVQDDIDLITQLGIQMCVESVNYVFSD